ncbi:hypothetical protein MMC21_007769 [Puttea exsequens]|nr:hypothetical protein [Puttea exsequens]
MATDSFGTQQMGCQGCSQEEKIVVFVGCTANGKSSLIRSILEYAGHNLEADGVEVGIGNKSTTKIISSYRTTVKIKDHSLKDYDGCIVEVDKDTDIYELEPVASRSDRHVHLLMLDTPGLDDSDNLKVEEARNGVESIGGGLQMRTVDEIHKFAVIEALVEAGMLHSVCFVLSIENTLGEATQRVLKEYLAIFEKSKLDNHYIFAHTYVNAENMFSSKASIRPQIIEETFSIKKGSTSHHLINNVPLHDDPISQHFADFALSNFLDSLSGMTGQPTGDVCYPKSDAHNTMDEDLILSVDIFERFLKEQITVLTNDISRLEASKRPLELRRDVEKTIWLELYEHFQKLDSEELVEIGYQFKQERAHLTSCTKLYFSLTAKAPIRDYKLSDNGCLWSGLQNIQKGVHKYCSATLEAAWGDSASGSITLLGWKKEALVAEVTRAKKEEGDAWSDYGQTKTQVEELETKIENARGDIALHTENLEVLNRLRDAIRTDHISLEDIRTHGRYFVVPNLCCYTFDQRTPLFPQTLLPYTNISRSDVSEEYAQKVAQASKAIEISTVTLRALELDLERKERTIEQLTSRRMAIIEKIVDNKAKNAEFQRWQPKSHIANLSPRTRAEVLKPLSAFQTELTIRLDRADDLISAGFNAENEALKKRAEFFQRSVEKMAALIDANKHVRAKWTTILLDHEASLQAARDMVALSTKDLLSVGSFTLLRKAIDEFGPESRVPWERLFESWREVSRCSRS